MIRSQSSQTNALTPDLTPLLDLIFIVMVFLLLTANVQVQTIKIDVPQTDETQVLSAVHKQVISINILAGETPWALNEVTYQRWDRFKTQLLHTVQHNPEQAVVIGADKAASVESMLKLLAFLQQHNIQSTNIIMEESSS